MGICFCKNIPINRPSNFQLSKKKEADKSTSLFRYPVKRTITTVMIIVILKMVVFHLVIPNPRFIRVDNLWTNN